MRSFFGRRGGTRLEKLHDRHRFFLKNDRYFCSLPDGKTIVLYCSHSLVKQLIQLRITYYVLREQTIRLMAVRNIFLNGSFGFPKSVKHPTCKRIIVKLTTDND